MCARVNSGRLRPMVQAASAAVVASAMLTAAPGLAPTTAYAGATVADHFTDAVPSCRREATRASTPRVTP